MAPTNTSKPKDARWGAAVERMKAFGFEYRKISWQLKRLLEVYGDDGWYFIESDNYRVLIDSILETLEEEEKNLKVHEELDSESDNIEEAGKSSEVPNAEVPTDVAQSNATDEAKDEQPPKPISPEGNRERDDDYPKHPEKRPRTREETSASPRESRSPAVRGSHQGAGNHNRARFPSRWSHQGSPPSSPSGGYNRREDDCYSPKTRKDDCSSSKRRRGGP